MAAGSFKFAWRHPAEDVYVTGTFDNWTKSEKLDKVGADSFEKTVALPDISKKIYYKFVVDNTWTTDPSAPQEPDDEGNINNFLNPEQIVKEQPTTAIMSSAAPESTTAELAKEVPLEKKEEDQPTPTGAPGTFPETPATELDKPVSVNPLPATDVTEPSIVLAPGEPIPPSAQSGDINAQVTLDKESYEKSDRLPGLTDENSTVPAATEGTTIIPESSLPAATVAAATINTVTPASTTAALAAEVPKETTEVPETVKESQVEAGVEPEASAEPKEVAEKAAVEQELKEAVPEAPSTAEGTAGFGTEKSEKAGIAATAITAGGIVAAAAVTAGEAIATKAEPVVNQATEAATDATNQATAAAADATANLPEDVKEKLPEPVQEAIKTQTQEETRQEVAPEVPTEVKQSITEASESPEAAGNAAAVQDKQAVESELLKEVKPVPAAGEEPTKAEEVKEEAKAVVKDEPTETPQEALAEGSKDTPKEAPKEEAAKPEAKEATNGTNGTTTTAAEPSTAAPATAEKKKKNRLSAFIGKLKSKVSNKD